MKTSKSLPYAKRNEERKKGLSLTKYELSKRARRLNYKPILDKPHQKNSSKQKKRRKERKTLAQEGGKIKATDVEVAVHNPANAALSPPPPSLPPSGAPILFRESNTVGPEEAMGSLSVGSPELGENEIKQLEDDVTNLFRKKYHRLRKAKKKKMPSTKIKQLRKQFNVIKYGYASKYATSQTKRIRKQKMKISKQLRTLRKKQQILDESIHKLKVDGSPMALSFTNVHTETHGQGHDGLIDHGGHPFK